MSNVPEPCGRPPFEQDSSQECSVQPVAPSSDTGPGRRGYSRWAGYAYIFTAMLVVLAGRLLSYRMAKEYLGEQGFAEFSLARNVLALVFPAIFLGLGLALPRYVALSEARTGGSPVSFLHAALAMVALPLLAFLIAANAFPDVFSKLVFAESRYACLVLPLSIVLVGLCLHALCYSYLYGRMFFGRGSLLEALNGGIVPVAAFWIAGDTTASVLTWTGLLLIGFSLLVLVPILLGARPAVGEMVGRGRTLLSYGARRVPGDFALQALVSTPAVLIAHCGLGRTAGMVAFGSRLVVMAGNFLSPVSIILLPRASRMLARGKRPALRKHAMQMLGLGLLLGIASAAVALASMRLAIGLYLGAEYEDLTGVMRIIVIAVPPYVVYVCLRSVIDAAHRRAINARNVYVSLVLYTVIALGGHLITGSSGPVLAGFVVGVYALGILTWIEARRILNTSEEINAHGADEDVYRGQSFDGEHP